MIGSKLGRLRLDNTLFFLCDIQKVFEPLIFNMGRVEQTAIFLSKASSILDIPLIGTEHKIKAFGPILESIKGAVDPKKSAWFHKTKFSMMTDEINEYINKNHSTRKSVVLFGIETHVCIQQTALELISLGFDVHIVADGVSSQREHDRTVALERIRQSGGFITSSESLLFELMVDGNHPRFKELLPLFKEKRISEFLTL